MYPILLSKDMRPLTNKRKILSRPLFLLLAVGLSILYVQEWRSADSTKSDFPVFYATGRLLRRGENPYSFELGCLEQAKIRPDLCMPYPHTSVLLPLFSLVSSDDYSASYKRWCLVLVCVLVICVFVAYKLTGSIECSILMLFFLPIFISITQGNVSPFILLGVMLWTWLTITGRDIWAGAALSLTVIKPQYSILLGVPLLFVRPKAFFGFSVGACFFFLLGLFLVGVDGYRELIHTILLLANGSVAGNDPAKMYSVTGLLARWGINRLWAWPIFLLAGMAIMILWRRDMSLKNLLVAVILTTFATPYLYRHDLSLLALPLIFVHPLAAVGATCLLLLSEAAGWQFAGAYIVMAGLMGFYLVHPDEPPVVANSEIRVVSRL